MPGVPQLHAIEKDAFFALICDLVVFCNLVYIGFEVDYGDNEAFGPTFLLIRIGFLSWCAFEFFIRIGGLGNDFFTLRNSAELIMVLCAVLDVALFPKPGWLWRMSGLRSWRMLRVYQLARTSKKLRELSLVLDALIRGWKALVYLAAVMLLTCYAAGGWARGILRASGTLDEGVAPDLNVEEYFGQSLKAALTMFQLSTGDGWAAAVVRPIWDVDLFGAGSLMLFTWVSSYTLLSLGIGVMVWATVEEARSGGDHAAHMQTVEDRELCSSIRQYFEASLALQDRSFIDFMEIRDAFLVPEIVSAIKVLELPMQTPESLFAHVDITESGRITVDELMEAIRVLISQATPFDTCCLTARIGGTATFTTRLVARTEQVENKLVDIRETLGLGIQELTRASLEDEELTQVPEVGFRKDGKIKHHKRTEMIRYTG
mmetsp:Transcript_55119/g.98371  ORF Transcript_55119/g.98371 Transcript_55119/m.98371 type:complete len:431 (-) Transcript_55119:119-1411(-)